MRSIAAWKEHGHDRGAEPQQRCVRARQGTHTRQLRRQVLAQHCHAAVSSGLRRQWKALETSLPHTPTSSSHPIAAVGMCLTCCRSISGSSCMETTASLTNGSIATALPFLPRSSPCSVSRDDSPTSLRYLARSLREGCSFAACASQVIVATSLSHSGACGFSGSLNGSTASLNEWPGRSAAESSGFHPLSIAATRMAQCVTVKTVEKKGKAELQQLAVNSHGTKHTCSDRTIFLWSFAPYYDQLDGGEYNFL